MGLVCSTAKAHKTCDHLMFLIHLNLYLLELLGNRFIRSVLIQHISFILVLHMSLIFSASANLTCITDEIHIAGLVKDLYLNYLRLKNLKKLGLWMYF